MERDWNERFDEIKEINDICKLLSRETEKFVTALNPLESFKAFKIILDKLYVVRNDKLKRLLDI